MGPDRSLTVTGHIWTLDQLETLVIHGWDPSSRRCNILLWLNRELARRETPYDHLRMISLEIWGGWTDRWSEHILPGLDASWCPLGKSLANSTIFPSLRSVRISYGGFSKPGDASTRDIIEQIEQQIRMAMPVLKSRGMLSVASSIEARRPRVF
jgi:hypothetical protein